MKIIKGNLSTNNYVSLEDAIDAVLNNDKELESDKDNLRSYLTKLLNNYVTNQNV